MSLAAESERHRWGLHRLAEHSGPPRVPAAHGEPEPLPFSSEGRGTPALWAAPAVPEAPRRSSPRAHRLLNPSPRPPPRLRRRRSVKNRRGWVPFGVSRWARSGVRSQRWVDCGLSCPADHHLMIAPSIYHYCLRPPRGRRDDSRHAREHHRRNGSKALLSPLLQLSRNGRSQFLTGQVAPYREAAELHVSVDPIVDTIDGLHATSSASAAGPSAQPVISILLARLAATSASQVRLLDSK